MRQADDALRARVYLPALFITLTLPDICAAIDSDNGVATKERYKAWVDTYLPGYGGAELWKLRCRLLHQGTAILRNEPVRYVFIQPGGASVHGITIVPNFGPRVATIDIQKFVADVSQAVRCWLAWGPKRENFLHRLWGIIQRRQSIAGAIAGIPIFA
ncbi:MAG: hypothetical protein ACLPJH_15995 [Myxococcaceae bacterium]